MYTYIGIIIRLCLKLYSVPWRITSCIGISAAAPFGARSLAHFVSLTFCFSLEFRMSALTLDDYLLPCLNSGMNSIANMSVHSHIRQHLFVYMIECSLPLSRSFQRLDSVGLMNVTSGPTDLLSLRIGTQWRTRKNQTSIVSFK